MLPQNEFKYVFINASIPISVNEDSLGVPLKMTFNDVGNISVIPVPY